MADIVLNLKLLVERLGESTSEEGIPKDLGGLVRAYSDSKGKLGGAEVAERLGLSKEELAAFERDLRDYGRRAERATVEDGGVPTRNLHLSALMVLSWFELLGERGLELPGVAFETVEKQELLATKQVRALELLLRAVVTESYGSQEKLEEELCERFGAKSVEGWKRNGDPGDLLSGTTLGEVASLVAVKQMFSRYSHLFEPGEALGFLPDRRKTLQRFLDDVRRIRNVLAHNRRMSGVQIQLLDRYFDEVTAPLQESFDLGESTVDPSQYLDASGEGLETWLEGLDEAVQAVRDDVDDLRRDVGERFDALQETADETLVSATGTGRKASLILVGVVVLGIGLWAILRKTDRIEDATGELAGAAEEMTRTGEAVREDVARIGEASAKSNERIAETLEGLKESFNALTKEGGVIVDADKASAHYHNARIYEQRGDIVKAMESYRRFFGFRDVGAIDPHLRYQELLKLQNGLPGAREIYYSMKQARENITTNFAWMLLLPREARIESLTKLTEAHEDFAPAFYALSFDYSFARLGVQTLDDKRQEKESLSKFFELRESPGFLKRYLDQSVAAKQIEDAKRRLAALASVSETVLDNPVTLSASRSSQSWMLNISIAEMTKEIFWRIGDDPFVSTGHLQFVLPTTGLPMASPMINLPLSADQATIDIKYIDPKGKEHGPYALEFNPMEQLLASHKQNLAHSRLSWVSLRAYDNRALLYFSHLLSYRGTLTEIRYGLNKEEPDTLFPFAKEDPKNPHGVGSGATYIDVPKDTTFVSVHLTFVDGTTDKARFGRWGE